MTRKLRRRVLCWLAMIALALPLAVTAPSGTANAALPTGFQIKNYRTGFAPGPTQPLVDFEFTPDNGFYSLSKNGVVNWTSPDGVPRTLHTFTDMLTNQDLGAITLTLGHRYGSAGVTPSVWIARVKRSGRTGQVAGRYGLNMLSEFPVNLNAAGEPVSLGAEREVLWFANRMDTHSLDDVIVDPRDGFLWVSVGDSADFRMLDPIAMDAQALDQPYGRIMRMDRTGAGHPGNPDFLASNTHAWQSKTYAKGLRNPFRMNLHPTLGLPMVGDVGWGTTEEQNIIRRGGNYGWPCFEGNDPTPGYRDLPGCRGVANANPPMYAYPRTAGMGSAAVGGLIYQGPAEGTGGYPASYRGSYFFADYSGKKIFNARINDAGTAFSTLPAAAGWANDAGSDAARRAGMPVSLKYAPNGDIAYADIESNQVRRITYSAGNNPPAIVSAQYETVDRDARQVRFSVSATDLDADPLTYRWDFGDGTSSTIQNPTKTYTSDGPFTARVTVSDGTTQATETVQVVPRNRTPVLTLTTPPDTKTYVVGEEVRLTGTATDADQPGEQLEIKWTSILYHCTGEFYCHRHPGLTMTGNTFTEIFTNHGDDTALEIRAEVTDREGVTVYQSWTAKPKLRNLTVTNTVGAPISINGAMGGTRQITVGSDAGISVPSPFNGITFARWSDGVTANVRTLRMPDSDVSLTGTYNSPIAARYSSDAAVRTLLGAPVGAETGDATGREQIYERGRMYWSASAGVHEVHGAILATYLARGGMAALGVPTSDEIATPDGAGRMNTFAGTAANPNPAIYWKGTTGAGLVLGSIQTRYAAAGGTGGVHGYPRNSELTTPNGRAQFNTFENGGIYWSPTTGAQSVYGAIYAKWGRLGWEAGALGLPTTSEAATPNGRGRYNHFEGGSIYWTPTTGANEVRGAIRAKWAALGWENSVHRFPITDELPAAGGRFNNFEGGSIYWSAATGAYEVRGLIRDEWRRRGSERSTLGFPTSDEFAVPGGRRSNFQRGYIEWVNGRINVVVR